MEKPRFRDRHEDDRQDQQYEQQVRDPEQHPAPTGPLGRKNSACSRLGIYSPIRHSAALPEAHVFGDRARANGIESNQLLLEDQATNFGENIAFVRKLLPRSKRVTCVTKPNSVPRVALTAPVLESWNALMAAGFDRHLLADR